MQQTFFPQEFRKKYAALMGSEAETFFDFCARKMPKSIWVNSLQIRPAILAKDLRKKSWQLKELFHENAFELEGVEKPGSSEEFKNGLFNLQEKASMIPAICLAPQRKDVVLDATAAPGNKTLQLATLMNGAGRVVAVEKNVERFRVLRFNVKKFGLKNVVAKRMDLLDAHRKGIFDKVLLDAPCSSEGLVRKDFDALKNWSNELVLWKSELQKKLALKCLETLKQNGEMVYSTCSLSPEENEEVVQSVIEGGNAELVEAKVRGFETRPGLLQYNGKKFDSTMRRAVRIYPQDNDSQAFFYAKIRKTAT